MTDMDKKQLKSQCMADLRAALRLPLYRDRLAAIEPRLLDYFDDCVREDIDAVNLYEALALRKFLRMLFTYQTDTGTVARVYRAYEFLKFQGLNGFQRYRLTPLQTFELAAPFLFRRNGKRLCTEANYFIPRKSSKTTLAAFFIFWYFFFEDFNAECYCVANARQQSEILFNMAKELIRQMDVKEKDIRFNRYELFWENKQVHNSRVAALSAGGKTKDGLFAQLVCADEYGSAAYVNDKSDMANLLNVVEGSMGPRKEHLTVITTTAGRVQEGPYQIKLRGIEQSLEQEMTLPIDAMPHPLEQDWQFALLCQPDEWERDDESLQRPEVWRKVNRHIGVTVQADFYREEWQKMLMDEEKKREQVCKLFNVWQTARVKQWLPAALIYPLQQPLRITDCRAEDDWVCFIGCDFSKGDDINAVSYLAYNRQTGMFFADMDAWITRETLDTNPNRNLYRLWYEQGWLHVCEGRTIDENEVCSRIEQVADECTILRIGYDAYDAKRFINHLAAWIFSTGADPTQYLRPVRQNYATYNSTVQQIEFLIKSNPALIAFSQNPMWGWQFGNCMLQESNDGMENVKPVKSSNNAKVDNVQALLSALHLFDEVQGTIE